MDMNIFTNVDEEHDTYMTGNTQIHTPSNRLLPIPQQTQVDSHFKTNRRNAMNKKSEYEMDEYACKNKITKKKEKLD